MVDEGSASFLITDFWSRRQTATAKSTCAAELVSLGLGIDNYAIPAAQLLRHVLQRKVMTKIFEDNVQRVYPRLKIPAPD